ncbi:PREDICTED: uncharacterized protein LOC102106041 [Pseudopodoces humilis]|uniref:uncharacterized protein LOC102106041 n=1 Tax=Pseudopodoces humilis TaxID=181119 RepID=UPI0003955D5C|nr:PREDICTED: uncharacterized protein LOC102106041 [Pseudopodoces humilis]
MNLLAQVSSSRQAVTGAVTTAGFFLCEGLLGQHFSMVPNGVAEPQPGDLFLFPLASGGPGWWGSHAGIYCGDGEIIHLEGIVAKHGKSHLLRTRGPAKVLRRKGGLDVAALQRRIQAAMDQSVEYNIITCNCIHFALALLGLGHLAGAMVFMILDWYVCGCELGDSPRMTAMSPALLLLKSAVSRSQMQVRGPWRGSPAVALPMAAGVDAAGRCSQALFSGRARPRPR